MNFLISGGASGIGLSIARSLAAIGHTCYIADKVDEKSISTEVRSLVQLGKFIFINADLSVPEEISDLWSFLASHEVAIQVLINNVAKKSSKDLLSEDLVSWNETMGLSLTTAFLMSKHFLLQEFETEVAQMRILNIGSINSTLISQSSPSYHIAKAGVVALTKYLSVHAPKLGFSIAVNCIEPGFIVKDSDLPNFENKSNLGFRNVANFQQPSGQVGREEDVAKLASWLCTEAPIFLSGEIFKLDGSAGNQENFWLLRRWVQDE